MKIHISLFLLLTFISFQTFACKCGTIPLLEEYQSSAFVATVKIIKVSPDPLDEDYHDLEVEILEIYKGEPTTKLKLRSALRTSCSFMTPENTTWLVFVSKDNKGFLRFGACSGSIQIDEQFDESVYPNSNENHKKRVALKLEALAYLQRSSLLSNNKYKITTTDVYGCLDGIKGFTENERFAIYEIDVNPDLTIKKIKAFKRFHNKKLTRTLLKCLKNNLSINTYLKKAIPEPTKVFLMFFYYPQNDKNQSFISYWDL
ncbi:hypothetical protein VB264_23195 [Arcicella aquatica]|uniref:Tissue inhibitor of metalloproteinase n=1 Tax=Arcicella aquatica TaxID=217141 RepID=A0ABU5QVJ7_9BACT|nr:hypothetical protein [Arcicella aquatica]MEA5260724.1 hypothetical protein [Arcicella aquatica]